MLWKLIQIQTSVFTVHRVPGHKFDCVQMTHMYVLNSACHKQGCKQLHMYDVCQAQSFCQRTGVTVGRRCDSWRVTEHQSRTFFSGPTPAPNPLTFIALAEWKIDTHNCGWNIFLAPTIEIPVLGILACDYRQTPTGREGKWTGGRFDTTNSW